MKIKFKSDFVSLTYCLRYALRKDNGVVAWVINDIVNNWDNLEDKEKKMIKTDIIQTARFYDVSSEFNKILAL